MRYFVYFLKSESTGRFYIGCTRDIDKRLRYHNSGKNKSTKPYRPWKLIYFESYDSIKDAYRREWYLKHSKGYLEKRFIIKKYGGGFA
ncbi:MAG: GIY-YIG nuclease family protein [Patescibacteria group bacterium]|nr:GIY-YIG nuclease family protein [Patescibacteria group bacterium]